MIMNYLVIEILGESAFHKFLIHSGWSGKDYHFHYNRHTGSHIRAYPTLKHYLEERADLHQVGASWALLANWLPQEEIDPVAMVAPVEEAAKAQDRAQHQEPEEAPRKRRGRPSRQALESEQAGEEAKEEE